MFKSNVVVINPAPVATVASIRERLSMCSAGLNTAARNAEFVTESHELEQFAEAADALFAAVRELNAGVGIARARSEKK